PAGRMVVWACPKAAHGRRFSRPSLPSLISLGKGFSGLDRVQLMGNFSRIVFFVQFLLPAAFVAQSSAQSPGGIYLSDDRERILSAKCGFGITGYDTSMHMPETKAAPLQI